MNEQRKQKKSDQAFQSSNRDREVAQTVRAMAASDGAGVKLFRSLGTDPLPQLDPFLLLDEFKNEDAADYIAGFPDHPHRGFETVTYMLAGVMEHRDSKGNVGRLSAGGLQWMTAGRGIIHSEMPQQEDGLMWGFQIWINLPANQKMTEPRYQDIEPGQIPEISPAPGVRIRVIAGKVDTMLGAVTGIATNPLFLDIELAETSVVSREIPEGFQAFVYVFQGAALFGAAEKRLVMGELGALSLSGTELKIRTETEPVRFLLLAAKPIGEPIARYGPFVMNTRAEIEQAIRDYRTGALTG